MIKYVFGDDHRVMYSVVHDRLTIWSIVNWWDQVKTDRCVDADEPYVQLIKLHPTSTIEINRVEICNFLSRISKQSQLLPRRSAIWCDRGMIGAFSDIFKPSSSESLSEIMAFHSLEVACFWLGATSEQVGLAKTLFEFPESPE